MVPVAYPASQAANRPVGEIVRMGNLRRRARRFVPVLALVLAATVAVPSSATADDLTGLTDGAGDRRERPECGPRDRPEAGTQGAVPLRDQVSGRSRDGYWCNLRWVGGSRLGGAGGDTQMTWYGTCAYRVVAAQGAASDGVAVVDVRDPAHPRHVRTLRQPEWAGKGNVLGVHEGVIASERSGLLVVPAGHTISTYDVSRDCTRPRLLSTYDTGRGVDPIQQSGLADGFHSGKLSPDGTFFYGTTTGVMGFLAPVGPCLTIVDLIDPVRPRTVARWGDSFPCHDLGFDPTGQRAFVGTYQPLVGHPAAVAGVFTPAAALPKLLTGMAVLDVGDVAARKPGARPVRVGRLAGADQHTQTYARIGGRDHVIGAEEASCPGGNGRIVDVGDPARPRQVAKITLGVNRPAGCAHTFLEGERQSNLLLYMSHYVSVDDPEDATLAFFSWYASGLRVFDIRDPANPVEVAYFNPPVGPTGDRLHDSTTTYPRYVPETGQIWVGSAVNAFWVVELDPSLRPEALRGQGPVRWSRQARAAGPTAAFLAQPVRSSAPLSCAIVR